MLKKPSSKWNSANCRYECSNGDIVEDHRRIGLEGELEYHRGRDLFVFDYEYGPDGFSISSGRQAISRHDVTELQVPTDKEMGELLEQLQEIVGQKVALPPRGVSLTEAMARFHQRRSEGSEPS